MTDDELADLYTDTFVATRDYEAVAHLASLRAVAQRAAAEALEEAAVDCEKWMLDTRDPVAGVFDETWNQALSGQSKRLRDRAADILVGT